MCNIDLHMQLNNRKKKIEMNNVYLRQVFLPTNSQLNS